MDGTLTAVPSVNEINGLKHTETASDYSYNQRKLTIRLTRDRKTQSADGYSAGHQWTEYFDIDYGVVIDKPDYDPDPEPGELNSNKYKVGNGYGIAMRMAMSS